MGEKYYEETYEKVTNPVMGKWKRNKKKKIKASSYSNKCPVGGVFGKDCDTLPYCTNCRLWDRCDDYNTELIDSDEKTKNNKKGVSISTNSNKLIVFPLIFEMSTNEIIYQGGVRIVGGNNPEDLLNMIQTLKKES